MIVWLMLAGLAQEPAAKYVEAAAGVELPGDLAVWREKGTHHARAIDTIGDRAVWARGMAAIDERLGLFVAKPRIRVEVVDTDDPWPARGAGQGGDGTIRFNIRRMAEYAQKVAEFEQLRDRGKAVRFVVPPTPPSALVAHELVHCYAGKFDEAWVTEGLATYAARETAYLWDFQKRKATLEPLGAVGEADAYARGYCALDWLSTKHGAEKLRAFVARIVGDRSAVRAAYADAAGVTWDEAVAAERDWSRALLRERYVLEE